MPTATLQASAAAMSSAAMEERRRVRAAMSSVCCRNRNAQLSITTSRTAGCPSSHPRSLWTTAT